MSVCSIVKLLSRGAVDDLMNYCTRPNEITVLLHNPFDNVELQHHLNGENVDDVVLLQNKKFSLICSILFSTKKTSTHSLCF